MLYKVILKNHGIIEGSLLKNSEGSYSLEQYEIAYNNGKGIQGAIDFAEKNKYSGIILPKGTYSLCYELTPLTTPYTNGIIYPKSNQIIDLNGSKIEIIYDSLNKSPYHTLEEPIWRLRGRVFYFINCYNSKIINGEIKGDIYNRSFTDGGSGFNSEKGQEHTTGIRIGTNTYDCNLENLDIHGFMGDAIAMETRPFNKSFSYFTSPTGTMQKGFYEKDGTISVKEGAYFSKNMTTINREELKRKSPLYPNILQLVTGGGFTRIPKMANNTVEILFFNNENEFIKKQTAKYLDKILLPFGCTGIKLQLIDEGLEEEIPHPKMAYAQQASSNIVVRNCKLHDNHRGGIANCSDDTLIEKNEIYNNGMDSSIGAPLFPDTTRYGINCEDSVSRNVIIRDNNFYNLPGSVTVGCYNMTIENNTFTNAGGIYIVNNFSTKIVHNKFYESNFVSVGHSTEPQKITVKNNIVVNRYTTTHISGTIGECEINIEDNHIESHYLRIYSSELVKVYMKGNTIKLLESIINVNNYNSIIVSEFSYNKVYSDAYQRDNFRIDTKSIKNSEFKNINLLMPSENNSNTVIKNSKFDSCIVRGLYNYLFTNDIEIIFKECEIIDSKLYLKSGYKEGETPFTSRVIIKDSEIDVYSSPMFYGTSYPSQNINYEVKIKESVVNYIIEPRPNLLGTFASTATIEIT